MANRIEAEAAGQRRAWDVRTVAALVLPVAVASRSVERVDGWQAEPEERKLGAGAAQTVRTRLATPPDPARKVQVSPALPGTKG